MVYEVLIILEQLYMYSDSVYKELSALTLRSLFLGRVLVSKLKGLAVTHCGLLNWRPTK